MAVRAVLLDSGDTIVDEGTEVKDADGITLSAELIPGAWEMIRGLSSRGIPLALVADGCSRSFENVLGSRGLLELFGATAISERVGASKPDVRMFAAALDELGVEPGERRRVLMVGNHLGRDVRGANAAGLCSVWMNWSPRRRKVPISALEVPRFTVTSPVDVVGLVDRLIRDGGEGWR